MGGFYRIPYFAQYARYIPAISTDEALTKADTLDSYEGLNIQRIGQRIARFVITGAIVWENRYCTFCGSYGKPADHIGHLLDDSSLPKDLLTP